MNVTPETPATTVPVGTVPAAAIPAPRAAAENTALPPVGAAPVAVDLCRCGHERDAHDHYRAGTDCGVCGTSCHAFHASTGSAEGRSFGRAARLTSALLRRR
ncbi:MULTISPECIES: hypothetical protein [unclassified Pseudonocardia]|uniref:hypothetical protein n=1 Tax=unclassified Pseudonocardia TaxID=2619320 RepID=UPI001CF665CF|nr:MULTISPECIES: hypothetical protein [unclassified Pseudonocardia]